MPRPTLLHARDLGLAFRAERRALRMTQQALADATGYRRQTIVDLEAGRNVSLQTLFAALAALGKGLVIVDARPSLGQLSCLRDPSDEGSDED